MSFLGHLEVPHKFVWVGVGWWTWLRVNLVIALVIAYFDKILSNKMKNYKLKKKRNKMTINEKREERRKKRKNTTT